MSSEAQIVQAGASEAPLAEPATKSMSIIVTKGSLDWAYPPFILATTAAAMGVPVTMFLRSTVCPCSSRNWICN